jgi:hypothetical protein
MILVSRRWQITIMNWGMYAGSPVKSGFNPDKFDCPIDQILLPFCSKLLRVGLNAYDLQVPDLL